MSFLKINDLLLVCIVQNHDADSPLYIIKNMFLLLFFVYSAFRRGTPGEPVECKSWIKLE